MGCSCNPAEYAIHDNRATSPVLFNLQAQIIEARKGYSPAFFPAENPLRERIPLAIVCLR